MREVGPTDRLDPCGARVAPYAAGARPDHAVAPERDVDVIDELANVAMRAAEVREDHLGPLGVAGARELLPDRDGILVGERVVPGPHRGTALAPALVRRRDIAEALALAKHVVPRGRNAEAGVRPIAKM